MRDYYNDFVKYHLLRCLTWDDIIDKKHRRKHNRAMDQIVKLEKAMYAEPDHCATIVLRLLEHEDERVSMGAGCYCIFAQVHVEAGIQRLKYINKHSDSAYIRVSAGQNLDYCKPFEQQ